MSIKITFLLAVTLLGAMAYNGIVVLDLNKEPRLVETDGCLDDSNWFNDSKVMKIMEDYYRSDITKKDFERITTHTDFKAKAFTIEQIKNKSGSVLSNSEYKSLITSIITMDNLCIQVYHEIKKDDVGGMEYRRMNTAFHEMVANHETLIKLAKESWPDCETLPKIESQEECGTLVSIDYEKKGFCANIAFCNVGRLQIAESTMDCFTNKKYDRDCGTGRIGMSHSVRKTKTPRNLGRHVIPNDVCSINGFQLRECEFTYINEKTVGFIHYGNHYEFIWNFDGLITDIPMDDLTAYKCVGCNGVECRNCKHGDEPYLRKFTIKTKDCSCSIKPGSVNFLFRHGSQIIPLTAFLQDVVSVEYEVILESKKEICQNCGVHCASGKLKIKEPTKMKLIKYCTNGQCTQVTPREEIELPISDLLLGRTYDVTTYYGIGKEKTFKVKCEVHELCDSIKCHFCFEKYLNPTCYGFWEYAFIIFISILSSLGIVVCFGLIYLGDKAFGLIKIPILIIKFLLVKTFFFVTPLVKNYAKKAHGKYKEIKDDENSKSKNFAKELKAKTKKAKIPRFYSVSIICLCLVRSLEACSHATHVSSYEMNCITKEDGEVCSHNTVLSIPMATSGQTSCFYIEDDHSRPLGTLAISTSSTKLVCNKRTMYWTYTALPKLHKVYQCFAVAGCYNSESCRSFGKDKIYSGIDSNLAKKSGESGCIRVNGGWGNGCGLLEDACVIYRIEMANKFGNYYEVFDCPEYNWSIDVTVTTVLDNQTTSQDVNLIIGGDVDTQMGRLSLSGPSMIPIKESSDCFMIQNKRTMSKVSCNSVDELTSGKVGELRCPGEEDAKTGSSNCHYNPNLVKLTRSGPDVKMTSSIVDIKKLHEKSVLPMTGGSHIFIQDGSSVELKLTGGTDFKLSLKMDKVKIKGKINIPKCSIETEEFKGCYLCKEGAVALVKIFASKPAGVVINCKNFRLPLQLDEGTHNYEIRAHLITPIVKESCYMQCDEKVEFSLTGTLYFSEIEDILHTDIGDLPMLLSTATWSFAWSLHWTTYAWFALAFLVSVASTILVWKLIKNKREKYVKMV